MLAFILFIIFLIALVYILYRIGSAGLKDPFNKITGIKEMDDLLK